MPPPLVVIEGPELAFDQAVREVVEAGWSVGPGFVGPYRSGRIVRAGPVEDGTDAEAVLLAALAGQGVVARVTAAREVIDRLVDDLRRIGPVDHRVGGPTARPELPSEGRAILGLLAEGHSLGEAAALLGLSRRTADRRLAEARAALGVERTTEAIARAQRLGRL
jgi:DNA-binding NarL/FixJ family response regulator